ncbi:membrane-spanning 4-domains subfamily A member 15-like isoform X1 [Neopelma chrysocephalum]|uniref:membrane-spanning 4-domains subfamily A member 15-like isoform X1 n=1 Tax=Neopelma chrysocephalum TaxID=114329 RepID=UPI000FCCF08E|nr:membrane-spanning 4-domains subfamily A member 15-like isoform X1 [Neopelma chrysocephalum]
MAATTVTDSGGVRIITEVIPATDPRAAQLTSGSRAAAPTRTSLPVQGFRRAHPKVLGVRHSIPGDRGSTGIVLLETIHIFTGIIHILFGIILTASEHENPSLPVASGILFWLGILLLISGSLLVESEKRDNLVLVRTCCVLNVGVALGALVATAVHGTAITRLPPGCERRLPLHIPPEWCLSTHTKILSNGLDSTFVLLSLLEFCVAVAALAFGYEAVRQHSYTHMAL